MTRVRAFAWLVLAALLVTPPAITGWNLVRLGETRTARLTSESLTGSLAHRSDAVPEGDAVQTLDGLFFETSSAPMTAAALQKEVSGILAASGAALDEFEHLEAMAEDLPFAAAELRVSFRATITAVQETLYRIEQSHPAMIVRTIDMRGGQLGAAERYDERELNVILTVRGFSRSPT